MGKHTYTYIVVLLLGLSTAGLAANGRGAIGTAGAGEEASAVGAVPMTKDKADAGLFDWAIDRNSRYWHDYSKVLQAIEAGADANMKVGSLPVLMWAVEYNNLEIAKALLKHGADANALSNVFLDRNYPTAPKIVGGYSVFVSTERLERYGVSGLIYAAAQGNLEMTNVFLDYGVDRDFPGENGATALMWAVITGKRGIVNTLLAHSANPNLQDKNGFTALMLAAGRGELNVVTALLERDANPNLHDKNGETALMYAKDNADVVRVLLEHGANPNLQDKRGRTALMYSDQLEVVKVLLEYRADPNLRDSDGRTFLMFMADRPALIKIVHTLLAKGADVDIRDTSGKKARDYARGNMVDVFKKYEKGKQLESIVQQLIEEHQLEKAQKLLEKEKGLVGESAKLSFFKEQVSQKLALAPKTTGEAASL